MTAAPGAHILAALAAVALGASGAAGETRLADGTALINMAAAMDTGASPDADPDDAVTPEGGEDGAPPQPQLWPDSPAVEADQQPYMLIRALRAVQDEIAAGSVTAHERQRQIMRDLSTQMSALPVAVWDDVRNVRAAIFFVLSGGNPAVLKAVMTRPRTPYIERRALRGALAYGEGRALDALGMLQKLEARKLDPLLGGIVALIQGTLITKKDPKKAIQFLDEARLLSPGTLIEEAALRQQILLLAREGELERFDLLTAQYSRRFPNSLFARSFRQQFFAGVARQNFKRASEWISRTETELMKVPAAERVGLYLAIAEEATKGGNIDIARFAAGRARELSHADSRSLQRAKLFEGAALAATSDFEQGVALLNEVDPARIGESDREIRDAALGVAGAVGRWPPAPEVLEGAEPESVGRARALLAEVDSLLKGEPQ
jgi:chemotaxis protein MotC